MTRVELIEWCDDYEACWSALDWLRLLSCETAQECYELCPRGDWLLWGARRRGLPIRRQVAVAAACARHVLPADAHPDSVHAVELAERYGAGEEVPAAELRRAANAAVWVAGAAASAAWASARAAQSARAMDAAADAEIAVAMATANAAVAWAARAARAPGKIATLVRKTIPWQEVAP